MEGFSHLGSMIVVGEQTSSPSFWTGYIQEINENSASFKAGISLITN